MTVPESNPFATRFIRAGKLPFRFPVDTSVEQFRERLESAGWRGQILGPHGSGKTTLLHLLESHWLAWNRQPVRYVLRDGQRALPAATETWSVQTQVIVDGYEQLSWCSRWRLRRRCRRSGCGLLVTTHRPLLPPTLLETATDMDLAGEIVSNLTDESQRPSPAQIASCFHRADGNMRETLLLLYDVVQHREFR